MALPTLDLTATIGETFPCGGRILLDRLEQEYGVHTQERTTVALDTFFNYSRRNSTLQTFLTNWRLFYDEAEEHAGLHINDVGKTYMLLRMSGSPHKLIDDLKLKIDGDLSRFGEIYTYLSRLVKSEMSHLSSTPSLMHYMDTTDSHEDATIFNTHYTEEDDDYGEYWIDEEGYTVYTDDNGETYYIEDDLWESYDDEDYEALDSHDTYYRKGKTKGKGKGRYRPKGRGKGKSKRPFSSLWRPFRPFFRPTKGKSRPKGKGKYKTRYPTYYEYPEEHSEEWYDEDYTWTNTDPQDEWTDAWSDLQDTTEAYKGFKGKRKGKGKGKCKSAQKGTGCSTCGAPWHTAENCPIPQKGGKGDKQNHMLTMPSTTRLDSTSGHTAFHVLGTTRREFPALPMYTDTTSESSVRTFTTLPPPHERRSLFVATTSNGVHNSLHFADAEDDAIPIMPPALMEYASYHTVKGQKIHGLLIDPGASSALMGTDTLREYKEAFLDPHKKHISHRASTSTFSGIEGKSQEALGLAEFPIGLKGLTGVTFTTDLMGGPGSTYPALLSLCVMIRYKMSLYCDLLPSNDGILVMFLGTTDPQPHLFRVYHTDSGHYMLPTTHFDENDDEEELLRTTLSQHLQKIITFRPKT